MPSISKLLGEDPSALRQYMQEGSDEHLTLRRGAVVVSLIGIAAMAATTLLQTGVVRNLPDPRRGNFHTKQVNSSEEAYSYGGPDSPIAITTHGVNMVLASMGGAERSTRHPWLPLLATVFAGAQAVTAARYLFWQMPKIDKAWCPYCIVDALTHFATVALTLPESAAAIKHLSSGKRPLLENR
ncbi:vitamin K epoxide reductase family protein [Ramlibacter sp. AN1015]|uniref:vitamin K epoxide reductase family protein n=1 Tax=Ramlibacter sp. AN1015 TaxID=3133428 RepID=UPI0030C1CD95